MKNLEVKVRFAPSPTGFIHIGGIRTALFNYLFAKSTNGKFFLRIEDTDQKRLVDGAEKAILESLSWLGITFDGEIVRQSERLTLYKEYTQKLLDKKIAHNKDGAVWVKLPEDRKFEWTDLVGNKTISFEGKDVDEFVILKSDGFPTYHLANVVDDSLMGITHVLRGEEWISSTPKHIYLYEVLGLKQPELVHLPIILGSDHTKLSKRHGAKSALDYRNEGFVKEAILNFIALLGWNPGGEKEQMSLEEMVNIFKLEDINTANPIFDTKKLEWLNGVWLRTLNDEQKLKERLDDYYNENKKIEEILNSGNGNDLVNAASTRMKLLTDFEQLTDFKKFRKFTKVEKTDAEKLMNYLNNQMGEIWESDKLLLTIKEFSKKENISFKTIFFLLTGKEHGIGILELNEIYGREFFVKNLSSE